LPDSPSPMDRLAALLSFLRDDPDDPFTRFALAQEYRQRGDAESALATFEALVRDHPDYVGTYYHLGKLYTELDRADAAKATFRNGIARAGVVGDAHARAELQGALLDAEGVGFDDD
jgi:tetratricopeptide (TPR) repeat protein